MHKDNSASCDSFGPDSIEDTGRFTSPLQPSLIMTCQEHDPPVIQNISTVGIHYLHPREPLLARDAKKETAHQAPSISPQLV